MTIYDYEDVVEAQKTQKLFGSNTIYLVYMLTPLIHQIAQKPSLFSHHKSARKQFRDLKKRTIANRYFSNSDFNCAVKTLVKKLPKYLSADVDKLKLL